jgi:Ser/Thr protein kinase RdoA (MazF antagonist)
VSTKQNTGVRPPSLRLLRRWEMGEPQEPVPLATEPGDRTWRVETATGPLLLRWFEGAARRHVLRRLEVTAALAAAGLPVPAPIPARDGHCLVEANHQRYALYPWIDGRPRDGLELDLAACRALGGLLGRLHTELDRLTPPVQQSMLVPTTRVHDAIALADRLLAALPEDRGDVDVHTERCLGERRELLVEFADHQPPEAEIFTVGYVHGDFRASHLRYGAYTGDVVAVLGWDRLTIAPFADELVRAATLLFGAGPGLDLERIETFVRGYAAAFALDPGQIQSAAHRLWWARLCDLSLLERQHLAPDRSDLCAEAAALVAWWTTQLDRTLEAFAAPYVRRAD